MSVLPLFDIGEIIVVAYTITVGVVTIRVGGYIRVTGVAGIVIVVCVCAVAFVVYIVC